MEVREMGHYISTVGESSNIYYFINSKEQRISHEQSQRSSRLTHHPTSKIIDFSSKAAQRVHCQEKAKQTGVSSMSAESDECL
jgi:hypothetical protein